MEVRGEIDDGTDEKEGSEYDLWKVRYVLEGPLWESVFLVPDDVLCVRTTATSWNTGGLHGLLCRTPLFPVLYVPI